MTLGTAADSKTVAMRLAAITCAAEQVNLYEFRPVSGTPVSRFTAGAHVDLHLPNGLVRQYSIMNGEEEGDRYRLGVKREAAGRGGSRFMHDELRVGTVLEVGPPRNNFPLVETAAHSVLIAGGIGVTPIVAMIARLRSLGRSWELHYAVRRRSEAAFLDELRGRGGPVHLHVDEEQGGVLDLARLIGTAAEETHLYCCGPTPMLDAFTAAASSWPSARVHLEHFSAAQPPAVESGFVVELARSKLRVSIPPGQTILEVLRARGVAVQASCEQGICGSCETRVLAGEPDHRDLLLSDEEKAANEVMMICCSGSRSPVLVLDL
ncbi:MAG TPA: PDR/VanB family oxidoreductase [Reyranella sp.]|nr:PDR/VanB family oxidoreductase [Reyranella sp.]